MLEPDGRAVLTEALRPPSGFELVHAVGTTFTLDLPSLIAVPLSFAGAQARASNDPVAIMESLRRHSARVDVFCQAGMIGAPRQPNDLLALVEDIVHPVIPPAPGGLFHPKVWVLEYRSGEEREYRFLCGSRNLTGDRSWDLVVRLDGRPGDGAVAASEPVSAFVRALPGLATVALPEERTARLHGLADRLEAVVWEAPNDVREILFHPMGVDSREPAAMSGARHLVVSPFLTDEGLRRVTDGGREVHVVSRPETFDRLQPATTERLRDRMWVLDDAADDDEAGGLHGLHAKAVVLDRQSGSRIFAGSANATEAAQTRNVEFMVELIGSQRQIGVAQVIGDTAPFRALLQRYETDGGRPEPEEERLDHLLEDTLRDLAALPLRLDVTGTGPFAVELSVLGSGSMPGPASVRLVTAPALLRPLPEQGGSVRFDGLALTEVTPFVVLRVEDERGRWRETVVLGELHGDLEHRVDAVLAKQLDSPEKFLRFLLLLLDLPTGAGFDGSGGGTDESGAWLGSSSGVFESLVRASASDPTALADLARIVDRIRRSGGGALPAGFGDLWDVLVTATGISGAAA